MIIRPVGAEFIYADNGRTDGQTDMTKLKVTFRNFANAPVKRYTVIYSYTSTVLTYLHTYFLTPWGTVHLEN